MHTKRRNFFTFLVIALLILFIALFILALGSTSGCKGKKEEAGKMRELERLPDIIERLAN